ncbi:MAG: metallo-beta-lactamase [Parvularculaceae bacterium]|nr:metallo-beta-lactamase [Parvularculaceae bacterium]
MKYLVLIACAAAGCATATPEKAHPLTAANPSWAEPFAPFEIAEGVYYVGTRGLSSFLVTTPDGHFLIDGGLPENARLIAASINTLGFKIKDVKYLLNSHAHVDHSGGLARLKRLSGATMVSSEGDRSALEGGVYQERVPEKWFAVFGTNAQQNKRLERVLGSDNWERALGSEDEPDFAAPPVKVDRTIADGQALVLGGVALTARLTPGHTRGCTSWTMTAGGADILFFCSATVAANRLVNPPQYEGVVEDYRSTFEKARTWRPDILLANHPEFFDMEARVARRKTGDENAFVDHEAFPVLMEKLEVAFEKALARQTADAVQP